MLSALRRYWFLLLLAAALFFGMCWAERLSTFARSLPRDWIIASVLLAMALPLRLDSLKSTLRYPRPVLLAVAIHWLLLPVLAWCASGMLMPDLALGLIIAAAVPCTLASAAVWTRLAGGNEAVSLLVTVTTNLSCFVVTPALIQLFSGHADVEIRFGEIAQKLLTLIVLPLVLGQLLRRISALGQWANENKPLLGVYAQLGVLAIVFVGAVHCGMKMNELGGRLAMVGGQIGLLVVLVAGVHLIAWASGYWAAGRLGIARSEQIAVAFAGSQKTLMVGLAIALQFGGLTILPMLAYHAVQLLIDTLLVQRVLASSR
ncbi:MAG: bile acid:sodium symporter [Pirellulales bacterium]|nr:bile acid:sodium symporter [Pirellulales bacterium]